MRLISSLKRAGYVGSALAILLSMTPVVPIANVFATGGTEVSTFDELDTALCAGGTITLMDDIDANSWLASGCGYVISENTTIDFNGHTITSAADRGYNIDFQNATLTFEDSVGGGGYTQLGSGNIAIAITNGNFIMNGGTITATDWGVVIWHDSNMTMNGGAITASGFAISGNGTTNPSSSNYGSNTSLTINGGAITSTGDYAIYNPQDNSTVEVNGGTTTGAGGAIAANRGNIVINGGTLTSLGTAVVSGSTTQDGTNGYANSVIGTAGEYGPVTLTINGGNFVAEGNAETISDPSGLHNNATTTTVNGGVFNDQEVALETIPAGKVLYKVGSEYVVDDAPVFGTDFPERVVLRAGESYNVSGLENATITNYANFSATGGTTFSAGTITAPTSASASDAKVSFNIYKNNGGTIVSDTSYNKVIKVHTYNVNDLGDIVLKVGESTSPNTGININNYDSYSFGVVDSSVAEIDADTGEITAVSAGSTDILVRVNVNNKSEFAERVIGTVYVYNFEIDSESPYDVKRNDNITFEATEANADATINYEVRKGDASSTDIEIVPPQNSNGGEYTAIIGDNAVGEYRIILNDMVNGGRVDGGEIVVKVHNVKINENDLTNGAIYAIKGSQFDETVIRAEDEGGFGTITCTSSDAQNLGARIRRRDGACALRPQEAGTYTVTLSDGVDSKTVNVYAIDFTLSENDLYVKKSDARQVISAVNKYWKTENQNAHMVNTEPVLPIAPIGISQEIGSSIVVESDDYTISWDNAQAGDYNIVFRAYANNGQFNADRTLRLHIYEMQVEIDGQMVNPTPTEGTFVAEVNETLHINVFDGNNNAYTVARVTGGPSNGLRLSTDYRGRLNSDAIQVRQPGVYTVTYTDYMNNGSWGRNGTEVGTYVATIIAVRPENQTIVLEKGTGKKTITTKSDWDTTEVSGTGVSIENGEVVFNTDVIEVGEYNIELKHNFSDEGVDTTKVTDVVRVIIYELSDDNAAADTIRRLIEEAVEASNSDNWPFSMFDFFESAQEVFGDNWYGAVTNLSGSVFSNAQGGVQSSIRTEVEVNPLDEIADADLIGEAMFDKINSLGVDGVKYYDVNVLMYSGNNLLGYLHQLDNKIVVAMGEIEEPETGYIRQYVIVRNHNGEITVLEEGEDRDFYIKDGKLYILSDSFSVYAVSYIDTLAPVVVNSVSAPDTGKNTAGDVSASVNILVAVVGAISSIALAGAVKFAKRK